MKILKVELQNINSLKSDSVIVIDFESNTFKDVGLYAITGSTGSGKTTILDAITIALYQNVPRLNKSKAGLLDVVSYGATEALARVTFTNNNIIYEAQWSLRVLSKTGKELGKPDEQVRLKDLTNGIIIAEKKKELSVKIVEITQLNYNQFLRSVMLAQGEFASFLSAKPAEKGALLEQITGEEIYRKIGDTLNSRIFEERRKVKEIEARVNNEDILSEEERKILNTELETIKEKSGKAETELQKLDTILNWFNKSKSLLKSKEDLVQEIQNLKIFTSDNTDKLNALKNHENAEPFVEKINNLKRVEKEILTNKKKIIDLDSEITSLENKEIIAKQENIVLKDKFIEQETENSKWQIKLQEVAELDINIKNKEDFIEETNNKNKSNKAQYSEIKRNIEVLNSRKVIQLNTKSELEQYFNNNKDTIAFSENINSWISQLTEIRTESENIKSIANSISDKEKELTTARKSYSSEKQKLKGKPETSELLTSEILLLTNKLSENNLQNAINKDKLLTKQKNKWNDQKLISSNFIKFTKELEKKEIEILKLEKEHNQISSDQTLLKNKTEQLELSLSDAKIILELEQKIEGFIEERTKLVKGEPCGLCGSTHHPLVEDYSNHDISEAKNKVLSREQELNSVQLLFNSNNVKLATIYTEIVQLKNTIANYKDEIIQLNIQHKTLELDCKISDLELANETYIKVGIDLKNVSTSITEIQLIQQQKEEKEQVLKTIEKEINSINLSLSKLETTGNNINSEIESKKTDLNLFSEKINLLKKEISIQFEKFSIKLPETSEYQEFINNLQLQIKTYKENESNLKNLNHEISNVEKDVEHAVKLLKEKLDEELNLNTKLLQTNKDLSSISEKRKKILPLNITTENKRIDLELLKTKASTLLDKSNTYLQDLDKNLERVITTRKGILTLITNSNLEFANIDSSVNKAISESIFNTKEEVIAVLLDINEKENYLKIRSNINDRGVAIKTKEKSFNEISEELSTSKNVENTEEESKADFEELKLLEKDLIERKGNIIQQIKKDNEIRNRNKQVFDEIDTQKNILKKWDTLHKLLGGSKDSFNTYVQRLTLERLIALANQHLYKLNKRYSLEMNKLFKAGEELNFSLVDHYQTDRLRPVDTTSGGEKFLISLALALGLSDLASNNVSIDSLFIDEGFGTLDPNMLETVISTLETLQTQGKMIGVISHVENLKERISTQIQIHKNSNGVSTVEIV